MAADVVHFPRADDTKLISFDELLTQIERLATVRDKQVSQIREAIFSEYRREAVRVIRAAGFICPDYE